MTTTTSTTPSPIPLNYTGQSFSAYCSLIGRPQVFNGWFRDNLQRLFSSPGNIEEEDLKHLIWSPEDSSPILVEAHHRWKPQTTQKRPAVVLKRNSYADVKIGIGDRRQGNPVDEVGDAHYEVLRVGSHTLFCMAGTGAQAELLGGEVERHFTMFGPRFRKELDLMKFRVLQVGAVSILEEAQENFLVPITIGYCFRYQWTLRQQAPLLQGISKTLLLEC